MSTTTTNMKHLVQVTLRFEVEASSIGDAIGVVMEEMHELYKDGILADHYVYEWTNAVPYEDSIKEQAS